MKKKTKGDGRKPAPVGNPQVNIRFSEPLGTRLASDAKNGGVTIQAVIISILAEHYRIEVAAPRRGRPRVVE